MNLETRTDALVTITVDEEGLRTLIDAVISAIKSADDWNFGDEYDMDVTPYHEVLSSLKEKYENIYGKFE
jgi:hypothetical protein